MIWAQSVNQYKQSWCKQYKLMFQCQKSKTYDIIQMKLRYLLIVFTVLIVFTLSKAPDIQASTIPSYPILLINLYHPQCYRCKNAQKQFSKLYELSADRKYQVAEINCEKQTQFCDQLKVTYPKTYLYVEGHQIVYQGKNIAQDIDNWLQSLIELDLPTLTQDQLKRKEGKQSFLLVGSLNATEKIQIGATKNARFIGIQFYQIQTNQKVFSLYLTDQQKKIDLSFPLNTRLFAFELFHRTRDHIMSVNKPEYLEYFRTQKDFDQHLILYEHHDKLSSDAYSVLDKLCFQLAVDVACFKVDKQSPYYEEVVGNFRPYKNKSSIIYSKKQKQKAYIYPEQQFEQKTFKEFLKDAKGKKRIPDYDYVKEAHDRMKYQYVTKIDDQEHKQFINNHTYVFVQYYSPFFENCTSFVTAYDLVGKHFKEHPKNIFIASLDADQELALADQQKVPVIPSFKIFVGGQGFHYDGEKTAEAIIKYITELVEAKLPKITSIKDIQKGTVGISGIDKHNFLHSLSFFYKDLPVYQIQGENESEVFYHKMDGKTKKYTEQLKIQSIIDWLQEQLQPVLVSLGDSNVPKKLKKALKNNKPILGLINKKKQGPIDQQISILTQYCEDKRDFVCGIAHQGQDDYQQLLQWIGDNDNQHNRLIWINLEKQKCFMFNHDLKQLTKELINDFIDGIKNGTVSEHSRPTKQQPTSQQQSSHEENDNNDKNDQL